MLAAVVPSEPLDFTVISSTAGGSISLEWNAPLYDGGSSLTGYYIYYYVFPAGAVTQSALIPATQLSKTLALVAGSHYALSIVSENAVGESIPSSVVYRYAAAKPSALTVPTIVSGTRTSTSLSVAWSVPTSATTILGYQVFINEKNSNSEPSILVYDGSAVNNVLTT